MRFVICSLVSLAAVSAVLPFVLLHTTCKPQRIPEIMIHILARSERAETAQRHVQNAQTTIRKNT